MSLKFSEKMLSSVIKSSLDKRVEYFRHKVADWESFWLMEDENGFFTDRNSNGDEILILWPFREYAEISLKNNPEFCAQLKEVNIYYFLDHYLNYIREHNIKLLVFPGINKDGALFDADNFEAMMSEELEKYEDCDDWRDLMSYVEKRVRNRRCLMKDYLEEWKKELFYAFDIAMHGHDNNMLCKECTHKYWDLTDNVMINPLLDQVRTLFRLFNNEPDYGILEGCYRVLTNIDDEMFIRAFIDELVTVYCNAPTWCAEFFERAIAQEIFFEYVIGLDTDKKSILIKLIKDTKEENSQLSDKCDRLLLLIDAK